MEPPTPGRVTDEKSKLAPYIGVLR
jgi:hypothetical protein